ncbi:MAG: TatD family hydrolase [Clostridia bacterium]|nr:TatD family hydrolase [Clostridia bacterium]
MRIFDSHAHYDDSRFEEEFEGGRESVLPYVFSCGVERIVNIGANIPTSENSVALAHKYGQVYASVGIHPNDAGKWGTLDEDMEVLTRLAADPKVVAIGEIGMDFYWNDPEPEIQLKWFEAQMELAQRLGFPVLIHDRDAHGVCMDVVRKYPNVRGVFHSYSGSAEMAEELIRRGWIISVSGVVTFKNARKLVEVVERIPLNKMMVETDCPYLAPHPFRGELNHSGLLTHTIGAIAEIKGITSEEVAEATYNNACDFYGIER